MPRTFFILLLLAALTACGPPRANRIVIGSKNFTEQAVLGEMFAQVLEAKTNLQIERRFYLAGTFICQQAMLSGRIDLYPEYTGTALTAILKERPQGGAADVYGRVKSEYERRFGFEVGPALGFNDTFAIEIRGEDARRIRRNGVRDSDTSSWSARMGIKDWRRRTVCASRSNRESWISACSLAH
jgi:osmoprotectant transport system substrate-binding protein